MIISRESAPQRNKYLDSKRTWEELDTPEWVKEGDKPPYDKIEAFFAYLYQAF